MLTIVTTQKLKVDNKFYNAVDEIMRGCQEIQSNASDEQLIDLATEIIESFTKLEEYYAN